MVPPDVPHVAAMLPHRTGDSGHLPSHHLLVLLVTLRRPLLLPLLRRVQQQKQQQKRRWRTCSHAWVSMQCGLQVVAACTCAVAVADDAVIRCKRTVLWAVEAAVAAEC
jgi:hypothetical protein